MSQLSLDAANQIINAALARGRELSLKPLTVVVIDASGELKAVQREDGGSALRPAVALGKAHGALYMQTSSRALADVAAERPQFFSALVAAAEGKMIPAAGGILIKQSGEIIGAVGISGDLSDQDEICAIAGVQAAGLSHD